MAIESGNIRGLKEIESDAKNRVTSLLSMVQKNPSIRNCITDVDQIRSAIRAFLEIDQYVMDSPEIINGIKGRQERLQGKVGMTIIYAPAGKIVFVTTDKTMIAMAPVLDNTLKAIDDITKELDFPYIYYIPAVSKNTRNGLFELARKFSLDYLNVIPYNEKVLPEDYLAFVALFAQNEVFKKKIEI